MTGDMTLREAIQRSAREYANDAVAGLDAVLVANGLHRDTVTWNYNDRGSWAMLTFADDNGHTFAKLSHSCIRVKPTHVWPSALVVTKYRTESGEPWPAHHWHPSLMNDGGSRTSSAQVDTWLCSECFIHNPSTVDSCQSCGAEG